MQTSSLTPNNGASSLNEEEERLLRLKAELHERLVGSLNLSIVRTVDPEQLRDELRRGAEELCSLHGGLLSRSDRERLVEELVYEAIGLGPLVWNASVL